MSKQIDCFEFESEMVYGKKHLNELKYNKTKYDFVTLVNTIFKVQDLSTIHVEWKKSYELFTKFGDDCETDYHKYFYSTLKSDSGEPIKQLFNEFVKQVILPYLGLTEAMVQKFPSFRIHLPDNVAVALPHYDHQLGHPKGEINFTISLTKMWGSNTICIEKMPRSEDYVEIVLEPNSCINFNGNLCQHYNKVNRTGKTRMSMDFRVLPVNYYFPEKSENSLSTNQKFVEGAYYTLISQ